jgi:hypothetical protein
VVEIHLSNWSGAPGAAVDVAASAMGLTITMDGSLRSYPGSRHWHLKKPRTAGTLEITLWPRKELFWVAYHSNRVGDGWVEEAAERMADELARILGGNRAAAVTS